MDDPKTFELLEIFIPVVIALVASSGFWLFLASFKEKKSLQTELLIGLAHDRLLTLGMEYINRGWITQEEYENLKVYLYKPYEGLGGNGSAKRTMMEVEKLPIRSISANQKMNGDTQK